MAAGAVGLVSDTVVAQRRIVQVAEETLVGRRDRLAVDARL